MEGRMSQPTTLALPRTFLGFFPFVWSRVLFPGEGHGRQSSSVASWLLVVCLPALLLYPCMSFYLFEPDEGRYAEIPREMLERGEWTVPYLQGEPYLDKPPLLYWLVMLSYMVFGVHDWAARLVPAIAVHACIVATYALGRRSLGERATLYGALFLCLMPSVAGIGRLLTMDGLLTLWVTLGIWCIYEATRGPTLRRGWWFGAAVAGGLGLLTKGPVTLILMLPPLWLHRRLTGTGADISWASRLAFLGVLLKIALPWYIALALFHPDFARYFLWEHNVLRFLAPFDHLEPFWYYLPLLALGLMPATLLLVPFVVYLCTADSQTAATRTPALGFTLLAGGWCVLFFSLSGCKLPTYILPAFPFLALAFGHFLSHAAWQNSVTIRLGAALALGLQFFTHYVTVPWYAEYRSPAAQWTTIAENCADRGIPVICYPRMCHSVAFYLQREDIPYYRSKEIDRLRQALREQPKTVLLLSHRHSLQVLGQVLPPEFELRHAVHFGLQPIQGLPVEWDRKIAKVMGETSLDLSDLAVVQPRRLNRAEEAEEGLDRRPK
jgi:hypothetical protein